MDYEEALTEAVESTMWEYDFEIEGYNGYVA